MLSRHVKPFKKKEELSVLDCLFRNGPGTKRKVAVED